MVYFHCFFCAFGLNFLFVVLSFETQTSTKLEITSFQFAIVSSLKLKLTFVVCPFTPSSTIKLLLITSKLNNEHLFWISSFVSCNPRIEISTYNEFLPIDRNLNCNMITIIFFHYKYFFFNGEQLDDYFDKKDVINLLFCKILFSRNSDILRCENR